MIKKSYIIRAFAGALFILLSSCTKNFEEINTNPNSPDQAPMTNVLAYIIQNLSAKFGTTEMEYPAAFVGHVTKGSYTTVTTYKDSPSSTIWSGSYSSISRNANLILEQAIEEGNVNMQAAVMVLKAYALQMVVDVYGPAPYFEAGLGSEGLVNPAFDTEEDIYADLMQQLDAANALFSDDVANGLLGEGDLLYGGNMMKWKKFCNSLHLRMAIRISNVDQAGAAAEISKILDDPDTYPVFEGNGDNALLMYPGTEDWVEPWTARHSSIGDDVMAKPLVDSMLSLGDPRLAYYADTTSAGEYVGLIIGARQALEPEASKLNDLFVNNPAGTIYFMTFSEVELIKAEAAARSLATGDAGISYNAGITANCQIYEIPDTTILDYLASPRVAWAGDVEQIYLQKWISLFHQSWEAWAEVRRTDVPLCDTAVNATTLVEHNRAPFRFPYPDSEKILNGGNIPGEVTEQDLFWGYQLWWDTRTGVQ